MILYFDSYITDIPLNKNFINSNKIIRSSNSTYKMPSKLDIAKYTLASYALYKWSFVFIRYEIDDDNKAKDFENYVKDLFPFAKILRKRSSTQSDYLYSLSVLNNCDDEWIWYSPNNDHPIITSDLAIIDKMIDLANNYDYHNNFISIFYSHFSEFINIANKKSSFWRLFGRDTNIIDSNQDAIIFSKANGDYSSIQIVNKKLFSHWFSSKNLGTTKIIRAEDVRDHVETKDQIIIVPKKEIAAHFDGYSHTIGSPIEISPDQVPPLFIPDGFFENEIMIAYGFDNYQEGFVNVNPAALLYSFENSVYGADLKCYFKELPAFWKSRIRKSIFNPQFNEVRAIKAIRRNIEIKDNPYSIANKKINLTTFLYLARVIYYSLRSLIKDFVHQNIKFRFRINE